MYDVHLGLIGKRVVDFLTFSLDVTVEALQWLHAKIDRKLAIFALQRGHFGPKFQVE